MALILSGAEISEHLFADSRDFFQACCDGGQTGRPLTRELRPLTLDAVLDEQVPGLLKSLSGERIDCLILSTYALFSPVIAEALLAEREALLHHVEQGRGLIVLPQPAEALAQLSAIIGGSFVPILANRPQQAVVAHEPDDVMLRFPERVDAADLHATPATGVQRLFWEQVEPDRERSTVVLNERAHGAPIVLRSRTGTRRRVVVSAIPFDWRQDLALARNALYFATCGPPLALVLTDPQNPRDHARARFMSERGGAVVREAPLAAEEEWLLHHVDLAVVPPSFLDEALQHPAVESFLRAGGTLTAVKDSDVEHSFARVTVVEGNRDGRLNVELVISALAARPQWGEQVLNDPIGLRAIVGCLRRGQEILGADSSLDLPATKRAALIHYAGERMAAGISEDNLVAIGARADTLAFLGVVRAGADRQVPERILALARGLGRERQLQLAVSLAILSGKDAGGLIVDAIGVLPADYVPSVAQVASWTGAVASADRVGRLHMAPSAATTLACILTRGLEPLELPWLTTDVSADILIGLAVLLRIGRTGDQEPSQLARPERALGLGNVYLRRLLSSPSAEGRSVPWWARLSEALLLAEDVSSLGLEVADARRGQTAGLTRNDDAITRVIGELRVQNMRMAEELRRNRAIARGPAVLGLATGTVLLALCVLAPLFGLYELLNGRSVATDASVSAVFLVVYSFWVLILSDRLLHHALVPNRVAAILQALPFPRSK